MPNTLCHIALQAPLSRVFWKRAPLPWIVAGCVVPDIPWILLRFFEYSNIISLYDARIYTTVQASLFFCLLLSFSLALCSRKIGPIFCLLLGNCLFHLIFDSIQIKWGNGVHFFAPFSWQIFHLDLFWPENILFTILTGVGIIYLLWAWKREKIACPIDVMVPFSRLALTSLGLCFYFFGPFLFISASEQAGNNYIQVLRDYEGRKGRYVEIDREPFDAKTNRVTTWPQDVMKLTGEAPPVTGQVSLQGYFISPDTIHVQKYKQHSTFRDWASLLGLIMGCVLWVQSLLVCRKDKKLNGC